MHFSELMADMIRDDFGAHVNNFSLKDGVHPQAMKRLGIFLSPIKESKKNKVSYLSMQRTYMLKS